MFKLNTLTKKIKELKLNILAIYLASRDRRIPWYTRLIAIIVAAYAFSPIDLIPDFIPVFGYLDDLILLPLGIILVLKLIPKELYGELMEKAEEIEIKPKNWVFACLIIIFWITALYFLVEKLGGVLFGS